MDKNTSIFNFNYATAQPALPALPTNEASHLTSSSSSKHDNNMTIPTFCKYSGVPLQLTPQLFAGEPACHFSKHWLFDQNYQAKLGYHHSAQRSSTSSGHQQRTLLALALLLDSQVLGTKIALTFPPAFPELLLRRNYHQIVTVSKFLHSLTSTRRTQFLTKIPSFNTRTFANNIACGQVANYQSIQAGTALVRYVCETITAEMFQHLDLDWKSELTETENQLIQLELEYRATLKSAQLATGYPTAEKPAGYNLSEYWNYILEDLQDSFSLTDQEIYNYRQQLKEPTNKTILQVLATYLQGLARSSEVQNQSTVPSIQFKFAYNKVRELIAQLELTDSTLDLKTDWVNCTDGSLIEVYPVDQAIPKPASLSSVPALGSNAAKLSHLLNTLNAKQADTLTQNTTALATATSKAKNYLKDLVEPSDPSKPSEPSDPVDFVVTITSSQELPNSLNELIDQVNGESK